MADLSLDKTIRVLTVLNRVSPRQQGSLAKRLVSIASDWHTTSDNAEVYVPDAAAREQTANLDLVPRNRVTSSDGKDGKI